MLLTYILSFDVAAIFICGITLYYIFSNGLHKRKSGRIFVVYIIFTLIATIYDVIGSYAIDNYGLKSWISLSIVRNSNMLDHLFRYISIFFYLIYMIEISLSLKSFNKKKLWFKILVFLPFGISFIIILLNARFNTVFEIVELSNGRVEYVRETIGIGILYFVIVYAVAYITYLLIKCRSFFSLKQLLSVISIVPLTIFGLFVQYFKENILIELFTQALSMILIVASVETISEQIDPKSGIGNYRRFMVDLKRIYFTKYSQHILIVKIKNYHELYRMYDLKKATAYLREMVKILTKEYKKLGVKATDLYSLGNGVYAVLMNDKAVEGITDSIHKKLNSEMVDGFDFKPVGGVCLMNCLEDFSSEHELIAFINAYKNLTKYDNKLAKYNEIKNDPTFIIETNLDSIIDTGLQDREFEVFYQPIYNIKENRFTSAEALVRLNSKKYGFIRPDMFIGYAERNGRIGDIDNYVLETVAAFVSGPDFLHLGLEYIEVNLSMAECIDPLLITRIEGIIKKYSLDTKRINLEITESYDSSNRLAIEATIMRLKELGFVFSLDDYGTGYSNIERFSKLPISIVKIDKSLVDEAHTDSMKSVLNDTFKLIKDLKRETVVEGIEEKEQLEQFKALGATYIQGYYFSKPIPHNEFIDFIKKNNVNMEVVS
ncbi:MAG: EAL domain-containing protein [Acholeplasmatales bacterium]|nr:EAL domain-containing protein [Acholeplasmatales bacterium]